MKDSILSAPTDMAMIYDLLFQLGVTANYTGFFHASYAIYLAIQQPDRLLLVTKLLYPEVAKRYGTTWWCVEQQPSALERVSASPADE